MKKFLSALVILLSPVIALAQGVTSTGVGTVYATPDCAHLSFSITTTNAKAKQANADNKTASDCFFTLLKKHKIDDKDVSTQHFNISPVHEEIKPGHHKIVGYTVSHQISVRVREMKLAGVLIDEAVEGNVHLSSINFMVSDRVKLEDKARNLALSDAKKRANQMVARLGSKLGSLRTVSESSHYPANQYAEGRMQPMAPAATTIATGQMAISVRVTANWDIDNNPLEVVPPLLGGSTSMIYFKKLENAELKAYPNSNKGKLVLPDQKDWHKANCLGFVLDKDAWVEPPQLGHVKNDGSARSGDPGYFIKLFKDKGFDPAITKWPINEKDAPTIAKMKEYDVLIAMYGHKFDLDKGKTIWVFTHFAMKKKGDALWTSKLGNQILVKHEFLSQFENADPERILDYGTVRVIFGKK